MYVHAYVALEAKREAGADLGTLHQQFSPETAGLLAALPDTPSSLQLKAEFLAKANELRRGADCGNQLSLCLFT